MLFAEGSARFLLILHTVLAAALVAVSTHLVVWMRGFPTRRFQRLPGVRKLATISACLFTLNLIIGNLIYPVYKVRVRAEYLDHPSALVRTYEEQLEARERVASRYRDTLRTPAVSATGLEKGLLDSWNRETWELDDAEVMSLSAHLPREAATIARWFDVKEHWVAFGMTMSVGCALLLWFWNPKREGGAVAPIAFAMAVAAAATVWLGALVGILVSSYRAIGGL